jgi:hypothetical protein
VKNKAGLWELGNAVIAAAREVHANHAKIFAEGKNLSDSRHWYFVMENTPIPLYNGYKQVLFALVDRALSKIFDVGKSMTALLVLEGIILFLAVVAYVAYLTRVVSLPNEPSSACFEEAFERCDPCSLGQAECMMVASEGPKCFA